MRARVWRLVRAIVRWWPLGYLGLIGFLVIADWQNRSLSHLRRDMAAGWVVAAVWFLSWCGAKRALRLERRDHQAHHNPPPAVPAPRRTPENGPYEHWLN